MGQWFKPQASHLIDLCLCLQENGKVFVHKPGKTVPLSEVLHEPVWVSLAEAQAYCNWVGGRVMTEEEYGRAADHTRFDDRYFAMLVSNDTDVAYMLVSSDSDLAYANRGACAMQDL